MIKRAVEETLLDCRMISRIDTRHQISRVCTASGCSLAAPNFFSAKSRISLLIGAGHNNIFQLTNSFPPVSLLQFHCFVCKTLLHSEKTL
jgi:hypothetical protein